MFDRLSLVLLDQLGEAGRIDLDRVSVDSASLRALKGAHTGAIQPDRGKRGSMLHLAGDNGVRGPLVVLLTAVNIPDGVLLEALLDDLPAIRMPTGHRRRRPGKLHGDKAYDSCGNRRLLRDRGIVVRIARRGVESSQRLGGCGGRPSARSRGCLGAGGCATSAATLASMRLCCWRARCSASRSSGSHLDDSGGVGRYQPAEASPCHWSAWRSAGAGQPLKQALLDAAHAALVEAREIPDHDRMQRTVEHTRADSELPPGRSDDFVLVEVTMFAGRSRQAKRRLYQVLVRNFGELGVAPADVFVVLHEPPLDNRGIRGGQMASEVDVGFEIQV